MRLPRHPDIVRMGVVSDAERTSLLAAATAMVVPSPHESLSMTALEAWAAGVPVLANGRSAVLAGQCGRSGGGLAYAGREEFDLALGRLLNEPGFGASMGASGRAWVEREYRWEVVEERLSAFIDASWRAMAG
jgi:glycosyltransferase involved in cell wall biosynthesis